MSATAMVESPAVRSLLLVRNAVDHDARVLRAARVAEQALDGAALVLGVATAAAPAGATIVEGVPVLRLSARTPGLTRLTTRLERISPKRIWGARTPPVVRTSASADTPTGAELAVHRAGARGELDVAAANGATSMNGSALASARAGTAPAPSLSLGARARRILSGLSFSRQAISVARQTRPTLVHANDWNTMWTGLAIKLGCGARLIYDSHELWPDRNGRWEWRPWLLAGEALFVRAADVVITSSPGYADALASRYRIARPLVVRNIPERSLRTGPMPAHSEIEGPPSPPRVVYVGGLMPGRGLEQMIDALPLIPDVRLCAIGPGAPRYRAGLLDRARAARVEDRVELCAPVAPGEVQSALSGAAAGLCLIQPVCRSYELSLPNKLFEYAAAGVPVLASDVPVIAAVVRGEGLGEIVPAGGPRAIAASLERLLAPHGWRLAAERARAFASAHDWPGEACTLAGVYRRAGSGIAA
jgi:glycosyltransferase involved in cell wall biosynthesis